MEDTTIQAVLISSFLLSLTFLLFLCNNNIRRSSQPSSITEKQRILPPSPPFKLPLIGHLHYLLSSDMPHHAFSNLVKNLGPIFSLQLGRVNTVVISSSKFAELVLRTHDHVFSNRPQLLAAQYLSFGCSDVTFSQYGPYWRQARKICVTELLNPKRVNSFQLVRDEETNRLLTTLSSRAETEVDVSKLFFELANDILCRVAFGKRFNREKGNLVEVLTETQNLLAGFCVGDFYPEWDWVNTVSGMKKRLNDNLRDLRKVCDEIIEEHLEGDDVSGGDDFVDVLLRVQKRDDLEVAITDDNLKALVLDMFVAGTDTTAATLEWIMTELARHPHVLKRAQSEIREVGSSGAGKLDETQFQRLHYVKAVVKETMRLHPPVPFLVPRESMEDCTLDGYFIPAKTRVLINTYAIGRDPELWENPLEYNPERFLESDIDFRGQDFRFLPFGAGRRGCPGFSFGLASVETALAKLLYHFDWALPEGVTANNVDLGEIFGLATRKRSALILVPSANENSEFYRTQAA